MLGKLFYKGDRYEANERIRHSGDFDEGMDLEDENDGNERDKGDGDNQSDDTLGHGEPDLVDVTAPVGITLFIVLENGIVNSMVGSGLEESEDGVREYEENTYYTRPVQRPVVELLRGEFVACQTCAKYRRHRQDHSIIFVVSKETAMVWFL